MSDSNGAPSAAATLFDLRTVIAVLFGFYGVVLTALGLFDNDPRQLQKSAGIDMNLWTGIGMLVVAALFLIWVWQRPLAQRSVEGGDG
jgi:drug/metabolite transporter (DMT)-like permease